jgi:hypothetical protein
MKKTLLLLSLLALISLNDLTMAADQRACTTRSGPGTAALLELYTSEGCNSCPPAERWLNSLTPGRSPHGQLVPLALHVDYWNYLGWPDPFAQKRFTERQVAYKAYTGARGVYTPQMFLGGREYLGWHRREDLARSLALINREPERASIALRLARGEPNGLTASAEVGLRDKNGRDRVDVYLVLTESRLSSQVRAGENRGELLQHDHVVRHLVGPQPLNSDGRLSTTHRFPVARDWKPENLGLVAFVQDRTSGEVLQAVALANCR